MDLASAIQALTDAEHRAAVYQDLIDYLKKQDQIPSPVGDGDVPPHIVTSVVSQLFVALEQVEDYIIKLESIHVQVEERGARVVQFPPRDDGGAR